MRVLTFIIAITAVLISLGIYNRLATTETTYRCEGIQRYSPTFVNEYGDRSLEIRKNSGARVTGFFKLTKYSMLAGLLSDDRHTAWFEVPGQTTYLWTQTIDLGIAIQLLSRDKLEGQFSTVSLYLTFVNETTDFEGSCAEVK